MGISFLDHVRGFPQAARNAAVIDGSQVKTYDTLIAARDTWNRLHQATPKPGNFMTWEYANAWWKYFGASQRPFILVVSNGDKQAMIPLMRSGDQLRWLATPGPDNVAILHNSAEFLPEAVQVAAKFLRRQRWSKLSLTYLYEEEAKLFIEAFEGITHRADNSTGSPYIDINGRTWDDYLKSISGSRRRDIKDVQKGLDRSGAKVRFESIRDPQQIVDLIPTIKAIIAGNYMPEKIALMEGDQGELFVDLCREYAEKGWIELTMVYVDDKPAAYSLCYLMNNISGYWRTAFHEDYNHLSLGKLMLVRLMENSFNRGDKVFDFMQGLEKYKFLWTEQVQQLTYLTFYRNPLRKRLSNVREQLGEHELFKRLRSRFERN